MWNRNAHRAMPHTSNYPRSVNEVLDRQIRFRKSTVLAVNRFMLSGPWSGSLNERKQKFLELHHDLCRIYDKRTTLRFGALNGGSSGNSSYARAVDVITLRGKLSVVTYLHEFAHALGRDERDACRWSVNLFAKYFPEQFARCSRHGHMLTNVKQPCSS